MSNSAPANAIGVDEPCALLSLPSELSNQIYEYVFTIGPNVAGEGIPIGGMVKKLTKRGARFYYSRHSFLAILQTCRRIRDQAQGMFYGMHKLCIIGRELSQFTATTSSSRLLAITVLEVTYCHAAFLASNLTQLKALQNLSKLHLYEPALWPPAHSLATLARDAEMAWLVRGSLKELAEHAPKLESITVRKFGRPESTLDQERYDAGNARLEATQVLLQWVIDRVRAEKLTADTEGWEAAAGD